MPDFKDNQSISGRQFSNLSANPDSSDQESNLSQSGQELLAHLGKTVIDKFAPDSIPVNAPQFKAGDILAGKYQIVKYLDRGNAGMIYQAKHLMLEKVFALKILSPNELTSETSSERFQREAHAAAALSHPNIIAVHDFGVLPEGTLYLAMEYLEGQPLSDLLEKEDYLDYKKALPIFIQTCLALEYAHTQGIIHRDLKPNNIMLIKDYKGDDLVKVIDFSIAKFTKQRPNQKTITKPGQIFGTPLYMSPEQCQGKKTDHRCDIYSLGCVMYETLCGVPPLMGDSLLNTIYKHVNELPTPFSKHLKETNIPKDLEAIIFKALAKQPENRYQSASELRSSLELIQNQFNSKQNEIVATNTPSYNSAKKIIGNILLFCLACIAIAFCLFLNARMH